MRGYPSIKALDYMFESYGNPAYPSPLALVNTFECLTWEAVRAGETRWGRAFKFRPGVRAIGGNGAGDSADRIGGDMRKVNPSCVSIV